MKTRAPAIGGQDKEELDEFIDYVNTRQPTSYLEVGAREGIALDYFVRRVPSIKHVTVVDWPGQQWGRANSEIELRARVTALAPVRGITYEIILGDSQEIATVDRANEAYPQGYDLVFIDADHSYAGAFLDYVNYSSMSNDMVALHDINHPPDSKAYGPTQLWNEVNTLEFGDPQFIRNGSYKGIGVILV